MESDEVGMESKRSFAWNHHEVMYGIKAQPCIKPRLSLAIFKRFAARYQHSSYSAAKVSVSFEDLLVDSTGVEKKLKPALSFGTFSYSYLKF